MEPDISPLAKRLAEENNVNWQGLGGSGANGRIVERDVLEYLAKVMAGDEDLNPTAEPVPEGMDAWPEEDTAGFFKESSASVNPTDTLTEVVTDQPSVSVEDVSDPFGMDDEPIMDLEPEPLNVEGAEDLFAAESGSPLETSEAASDVHISEDIFLFDEDADSGAEDDAFASFGNADSSAAGDPVAEDDAFSSFGTETQSGSPSHEDLDFTDVPVLEDVEADALGDAEMMSEDSAEETEAISDLFGGDTSEEAELFSSDSADALVDTEPDNTLLEPIAANVTPGETESTDVSDGIESETLTPAPLPASDLPLSTFGVLLRRHADLGAAMQAQLSISHELGHGEPINLSSLLVRAAAKALQTSDIAKGQGLGLTLFEESGVRVAPVDNAHAAPFRDLLEQLSSLNADDTSTVGLAVADMSDFDVDEAVLNLDVPVLALGRIMQDSEQGSQHSTLTLSGDVSVEVGTKFLSTVAELLAAPVRLVL